MDEQTHGKIAREPFDTLGDRSPQATATPTSGRSENCDYSILMKYTYVEFRNHKNESVT